MNETNMPKPLSSKKRSTSITTNTILSVPLTESKKKTTSCPSTSITTYTTIPNTVKLTQSERPFPRPLSTQVTFHFRFFVTFHFGHFPLGHFPLWSLSTLATFYFGHFPLWSLSTLATFYFGHFPLVTFHFGHFSLWPLSTFFVTFNFGHFPLFFVTFHFGHFPLFCHLARWSLSTFQQKVTKKVESDQSGKWPKWKVTKQKSGK